MADLVKILLLEQGCELFSEGRLALTKAALMLHKLDTVEPAPMSI